MVCLLGPDKGLGIVRWGSVCVETAARAGPWVGGDRLWGGGGAVLEISGETLGQKNQRTRSASGDLSKTMEGLEVLWHLALFTNLDFGLLMGIGGWVSSCW